VSEREIVTLGRIRRELVRAVRRIVPVDADAARVLVVGAVQPWLGEADADNHVRAWLEENVELGGCGTATSTELYDDYVRWCADRGIRPVTSRRFVPALVRFGLERCMPGGVSEFLGVRLRRVPDGGPAPAVKGNRNVH